MTVNIERIKVLLDLLEEELPKGTNSVELWQLRYRWVELQPSLFSPELYSRVQQTAIETWNSGHKIQAIKDIRPEFPDLDLLQVKRLLETHPQTK